MPVMPIRLYPLVSGLILALAGPAPVTAAPSAFRDLNHNGALDAYEDVRLAPELRADDLLRRMTLEEKAGLMMHGSLRAVDSFVGASSKGYDVTAAREQILKGGVNSFITRLTMHPAEFARQNNAIQKIAEEGRLGIPVTVSSDPRSHFQTVVGASSASAGFSVWPETLGFAALRDPALVRRFGSIVAREYRAVGIHMALSPQADLATEPRWPRGTATFGSDAALVSSLAGAYVQGFQGGPDDLKRDGVATVVKHWVGYGAQPEGFDGHNHYGRHVRLNDASFALHVAAFKGALDAGSSGVMPTYGIVEGVRVNGRAPPSVGAGFSRPLLTGLLRGKHRYKGMILSDWAITNDCPAACVSPSASQPQTPPAIGMPWGVESLSREDRFAMGVNAGIDQFGGVEDSAPLLAAVRNGKVSKARIDEAARRILLIKFRLGLFDNPYVDPDKAAAIAGDPASQALADAVQRKALVLLENRNGTLPLRPARVWLHGVAPEAARAAGLTVVDSPDQADAAIVRMAAPSEKLHPYHFFGSHQNEGRLDFRDGDAGYEAVKRASAVVPVIAAIDMDRPAILTNIHDKVRAMLVAFGASDAALLDVIAGRARAEGRLPFELPSSMREVEAQDPAKPDDTAHPLYRRGTGIVPGA